MANAVIGSLRVNLGLDSATFNKGLKSAESSLSRFGSSMRGLQGTIAGLAGAAGIGMVAKAFMGISQSADEMGKLSQKFGVPIEELSGLAYAAQMADVDIGGLAGGLRKLSTTMAEAASNSKSGAAAAFTAVGISVRDAEGKMKTASQVLTELSAKFAGYEDGANKTALAVQFFGRAGADLIPLLNQGAAALDESAEKARKYGLIVSQETAVAADQFNDNIEDMGNLLRGVLMSAFAQLSGPLSRISGDLLNAAENTDLLTTAGKRLADATLSVIGFLAREMVYLRRLGAEVAAIAGIFEGLGRGNSNLKPGAIVNGLKQLKQAGADAEAELKQLDDTMGDLIAGPAASDAGGVADRINQAFDVIGEGVLNLQQTAAAAKPALTEAPVIIDPARAESDAARIKKASDEVARAQQQLGEEMTALYEQTRTPAESAALEIERLNQLFRQGLDFDVYTRAVQQVNDSLKETWQIGEDVARTFENSFMSAFDSMMAGTFRLKDAIGNLLKDLARLFMQQAVQSMLGTGGGGAGIFASMFGGGGMGGGGMAPAMAMPAGGGGMGGGGASVSHNVSLAPSPFFLATVDRQIKGGISSMADRRARGLP